MNDRLLRACRCEKTDRTPIWLMRQAGRYLAEYRALREQHSFLAMVRTPELAVEVTLQPLRRFALDAAIIFADILPVLAGMGIQLEYAAGEGPVIHNPLRTRSDVESLRVPPPEENVAFTLEALRLARRELEGKVPLIGFSGAPFTLASYAIEGGGSSAYVRTKSLMHGDPDTWHMLMERLAAVVGGYLAAQVRAGAQAVQLFDSWAGALSPADYRACVLPYSRRVIEMARGAGAPLIHFSTGTAGMLGCIREAGGDVIGVDWRIDLDTAWERIGEDVGIQGNLDPALLRGPLPALRGAAADILARANGRPGHIFNLGHGITPETPADQVAALVDYVHAWQPD